MQSVVDAVTFPLRLVGARLICWLFPDMVVGVMEDVPLIARRTVELAIDEVGVTGKVADFIAAVHSRLDGLGANDQRALTVYTLLNGFQCREDLWASQFHAAMERRLPR